jgi:hypothetical protein
MSDLFAARIHPHQKTPCLQRNKHMEPALQPASPRDRGLPYDIGRVRSPDARKWKATIVRSKGLPESQCTTALGTIAQLVKQVFCGRRTGQNCQNLTSANRALTQLDRDMPCRVTQLFAEYGLKRVFPTIWLWLPRHTYRLQLLVRMYVVGVVGSGS